MNTQPIMWETPDDVSTFIEPILNVHYPSKPKGHRRVNMRVGYQWNYRLAATLGDILVDYPRLTAERSQPLCVDKGMTVKWGMRLRRHTVHLAYPAHR